MTRSRPHLLLPHTFPLDSLPRLVLMTMPTPKTLLRMAISPVVAIGLLTLLKGNGSSDKALLLLTKGVIGPMADTVSEGPPVRVRAAVLGPMAVSTNRGPVIRLRTSAVGSVLVVTPGSKTSVLLMMVVPLTVIRVTTN